MNKNRFFNVVLTLSTCALLLGACQKGDTGETGPKGEPGVAGKSGLPGIDGRDGLSVLTGHGNPSNSEGVNGDSYIDLDTWNYYTKTSYEWGLQGNIKGSTGETGVSIVSAIINDDGDLIVTFSNQQAINAGHIRDVGQYTVSFYCGDLLVDVQNINYGEKLSKPEIADFEVKHWYLDKDFEFEWLLYGSVVTEDMTLYGDYTAIEKHIQYDKTKQISIDEYGYGVAIDNEKEICVSKAIETTDYLTVLDDRGILFNKEEIGLIDEITINIDSENFESAKIYYGNTPLSFDNNQDLSSGTNVINLSEAKHFTIQNTGEQNIGINSIRIQYKRRAINKDTDIPTVVINTKNSQAVTSRTTYIDCNVSTIGADNDVSELSAQIKIRGNSTANLPKKPYRIKLDKKSSLFGYEKAKNWVLLADYLDGSNMHNYSALNFANLVRGGTTFGVKPLHVSVTMNGLNLGLYLFCEHIDAKEGRLNLEQNKLWEKSFDEMNFYIERDYNTIYDSTEIEGQTFFKVNMENYSPSQYVFALKYPEKEDFEEKLQDGSIDAHEDEFNAFFNYLKDYITDICNKFVAYSNDKNEFSNLASSVDLESLAVHSVTDQFFKELDHGQKSFKMYRLSNGLLKFGPNWDYDLCVLGLPIQASYCLNPFSEGTSSFHSSSFGEKWGYMLFNDLTNGRPLFKQIWESISDDDIDVFLTNQMLEMHSISKYSLFNCEQWMNRQYYCILDNQMYYWKYMNGQFNYLKNLYKSLQ